MNGKTIGKASISVVQPENENATITISTRDFIITGTITIQDGILTWGEITANDGTTPTSQTTTKTLSSIAITTDPAKKSYNVGEALDLTGIVVTATYSDSTTSPVTATYSPANGTELTTAGTTTITASYTEGGVTKTATTSVEVVVASTGTSITVNGTDIDLSTLNASTVGQYYGTTVKTININNQDVEFGLFYVDYAGTYSGGEAGTIYLRAKSRVGSTKLYDESNNIPSLSSDALNIMKQLNPQWNSARGTATSLTSAEQGAQHLCNPAVSTWSAAKTAAETEFGASNVNYVIGGPSVELFMASYNAKVSPSPAWKATWFGAGEKDTYPGYLYSIDNGTNYSTYYSSAIPTADGMYRNSSYRYWLASPLSGNLDSYVCNVDSDGRLNIYTVSGSFAVAPLVSLKSGVDLTQD